MTIKIIWRAKNRGQVLVLYALLIPMLFLCLGVGLDLGWYFLNVSRLQNAADAAVVAGAQALAKDLNSKATTSTSTITETETSGDATTTTTTTTKTTDIYTYKRLVDKYPVDKPDSTSTAGDAIAEQYVIKNIGENREIPMLDDEGNQLKDAEGNTITNKIIADKWSKGGDPKVTMTPSLYKDDDKYYYVIHLSENIQHFFLPGWFDDMVAPVVAVALISKGTDTETLIEKITKALEEARDKNVIVGNWEVQNYYRQITTDAYTITLAAGDTLIDENGHVVLDSEGNPVINQEEGKQVKIKRSGKFYNIFGKDVYTGAWNHFQDFYHHYYLGNLYRKQTVIVQDDLDVYTDSNGKDVVSRYGENSNVAATAASINKDPNSPAYNPGIYTRKTYKKFIQAKDGKEKDIDESDTVGLPYTWKIVDSVNIDFRPEITFSGKWLSEDWDLEVDDYDGLTFKNNDWASSGSDANKIGEAVIKRLRIHTSINFEEPYKDRRSEVDTDSKPDILWTRIESEPMLNTPDVTNRSKELNLTPSVQTPVLNSVNQIILNFNQTNYDKSDQRYRPVIIFYDGPETYSIYPDYDTKNKFVRESKPIIVNLNEPYRAILYAPNSPVAVIGKNKGNFKGFIMAKNYVRLKNDDDFIEAEEYLRQNGYSDLIYSQAYRYFNNANRQWEYNRKVLPDGTVKYQDVGRNDNTYSSAVTSDDKAYRLKIYYRKDDDETDPAKKERYYKVVGKTDADTSDFNTYEIIDGMKYIKVIEENGIDMYVDDRGDIQIAPISPPTDCGEYDTLGRIYITESDGTDRKLDDDPGNNMLLSGE